MTDVRIFFPSKTAMQSAKSNTQKWKLEYEPTDQKTPNSLIGWTTSSDTNSQISLYFDTKEQAVEFAEKNDLSFRFVQHQEKNIRPKNYAGNFDYNRKQSWTH